MTTRGFLRSLRSRSVLSVAALSIAFLITSNPVDCASLRISRGGANPFVTQVAVFSDDPEKFRDPRFAVTAEDELRMLTPIGHATTWEPVLLQNADDELGDGTPRKYGVTTGTTFMVSPCIALTNYHVVFGQTREPSGLLGEKFRVRVSVSGKTAIGVPFVWGDFAQGPENDWAALRVTPCIGSSTGWFPIAYNGEQQPREVSIFGFYTDQDYSLLAGQDCVLMDRSPSAAIWKTNCAIVEGTSGSPIGIFKQGSFQPTAMAFAMVRHRTSKITYDPQDANFAIDLSHLLLTVPSLSLAISDDMKACCTSNPAQLLGTMPKQRAPHRRFVTPDRPLMPTGSANPIALPPVSRDLGLPPTPADVALPPAPRPIALPPDPVPLPQ
jgi:V8-like Glu-specific endopeptidase